jgi:hypothetical protein
MFQVFQLVIQGGEPALYVASCQLSVRSASAWAMHMALGGLPPITA